ncbi:MAG: DUF6314 family protein [Paracoccaceae bacterium]|nr:DUF6314 family protein [Paracoccaceae bacterium]MDG2257095.1 DUF6314 family protein [Paracoccaceae bacterium]
MPELWDFEGSWQVSRWIKDALIGQSGNFEGLAEFKRDELGLRYIERGILKLGAASMQAERCYLWRVADKGIEVQFEDRRAFHHIDQSAEAAHWCDPDQYNVTYEFGEWPEWSSRWAVKGPRKDYEMVSNYRR